MRTDILERKEEILQWIKEEKPKRFMCEQLNCKPETLNSYLEKMGINYAGQQAKKGQYKGANKYKDVFEYLEKSTNIKSPILRKKLIESGIKEDRCEICGISEWQGVKLPLELHHKDTNHYNNNLENLQILCPNCHSQAPTHRNKDGKKYTNTIKTYFEDTEVGYKKICPICGKEFVGDRENRKYCSRKCYNDSLRENKELHITEDALKQAIPKCNSITDIAKYFDVSRPTIRKHLERYGLINLIKEKYDFHAKPIIQYTMNGEFVKEWPSVTDAEKSTGIDEVGRVANFKRKSAGGYVWRWKE